MTRGGLELTGPPRAQAPTLLIAQLILTAAALALQTSGTLPNIVALTPVVCGLLLVFGLPHGTLDLELLRRSDADAPRLDALLVAYGACAVAMYTVWQLAPLVALLLFFVMAVEHFAEDWEAIGSRFVAYGTAVALIATPALRHRDDLAAIFATLTESSSAVHLGDLMLIVAPVTGVIALAGTAMLWQRGDRRRAVGLALALVAEALLPPVIGFALFFCFVHSPHQLREALRQLHRPARDAWWRVIVPLTLVAIALAAVIGVGAWRVSSDAAALRAGFITLSVLTLPHMVVPYLVRRFRAAFAANRPWASVASALRKPTGR